MTPDSPRPSEGSPLPPRHRPSLGDLVKDTTELDLWAFDDDLDLPDGSAGVRDKSGGESSASRDIPVPRERKKGRPREIGGTKPGGGQAAQGPGIQMNVSRAAEKIPAVTKPAGPAKPEGDFDDLESWQDLPLEPELEDLPAVSGVEEEDVVESPPCEVVTEAPPSPVAGEPVPTSREAPTLPVKEAAGAPVAPGSVIPRLELAKAERIGLIALVAVLVIGAAAIVLVSRSLLPGGPERVGNHDFPVKGSHVSVTAATSYWRVPITEGPNQDTVRRGTALLPVLELSLAGGPAGIRVLFRNEEREVIGDAVTLTARSGTMVIPATAGFDDIGMHAAYRAGESKPWTIEVFEAPAATASGREFQKLFEMIIATDRR